MTDSNKYTRVMSREEYDGAIAAGEEIDEEAVIVVEPLGEPQPISDEEADRLADG